MARRKRRLNGALHRVEGLRIGDRKYRLLIPRAPPTLLRSAGAGSRSKSLERETGIGPATNSLEGCDSTTELLPPCLGKLKDLELTERLELSTFPLPRECSTTELRQLEKTNLTILPRTHPSEYDAEGKKS